MVSINRIQYQVLKWLSDKKGEPPNGEWKTSARALERRNLVTVSRNTGKFAAVITNEGARYLLDNPEIPVDKPRSQPHSPKLVIDGKAALKRTTSARPKGPNRQRHPAVRSLSKYRGALPRDREAQRRAIDAADALVNAALDAGFGVEGHEQPTQSPISTDSPFTGCRLVTIAAEHVELTVTIGEQLKRVPHELTEKEKADEAKYSHSWARSYDYVRTGKTFFRIKYSSDTKKFLETSRKPLVDYVPNLIRYIERQQIAARERKEAAERAAIERAEREAEARKLEDRRKAYAAWEKALVISFEEWDKLHRLRNFIDRLESSNSSDTALLFIAWARGHVDALDPVKNFQLPTTDIPDLTHKERAHYGEYKEPTNRYRYGYGGW